MDSSKLVEESRALEAAGRFGQALELAQRALEQAEKENDPESLARARTAAGLIEYRLGHYPQARQLAEQVLANTEENSRARVEALLLLGNCAMEQDSLDEMESCCLKAAEICRCIGFEEARFRALHNLSQVYSLRGQFDLLIAADEEAYRIGVELDLPQQTIPLISMAFVYIRTGQSTKARATIEKIHHNKWFTLLVKGYCAMLEGMLALFEGDYENALTHYHQARSAAEETGDPALQIFVRLGLSRYHRLNGNPCAAMEWAEDAVAWATRSQNRRMLGRTLIERGYAAWLIGDPQRARADLMFAVDELGKRQQWYDQAYARFLLAALLHSIQDIQAITLWREAAEQILQRGYEHLLDQERQLAYPIIAAYLEHPDPQLAQISSRVVTQLQSVPAQRLTIYTLGEFEVYQGGIRISPQAWRKRRAGELFRLLLISPQRCLTQEQVIEALWPDKHPHSTLALLHHATSTLRRVLEPELPDRFPSRYILVDEGMIALHLPPGSWIDFEQFQQAIRDEKWEEAISLYQGDLYPQDQYADWAILQRERLRQYFVRALMVMAHRYTQNRQPREVLDTCQRILEIDPWQEEAVFLAMQACLSFNDRAGAIRFYKNLERTLSEELAVQPQKYLRDLYHALTGTAEG